MNLAEQLHRSSVAVKKASLGRPVTCHFIEESFYPDRGQESVCLAE